MECAAGTYNDGFYKNSCKSCPEETSSKKIGAKYYKECYGMYQLYQLIIFELFYNIIDILS